MRRTRKWAFVAQEATRLAGLGLSPAEIAERLGVNKSTVTRWMKSGKLARTTATRSEAPAVPVGRPGQSPAEWAKAVRDAYDLDATDEQLVTVAEEALTLALDLTVKPAQRMTAAGRFQALVKQLALVARAAEKDVPVTPVAAPAAKPMTRDRIVRSGVDPRNVLQAVK